MTNRLLLIPLWATGFISVAAPAQIPSRLPPTCKARSADEIRVWVNRPLSCGFDRATMTYAGSPAAQARCLLRLPQVGSGEPVPSPIALPAALEALIGNRVAFGRDRLAAYLESRGISEAEVGGNLAAPLARTSEGKEALYFVIHDTSSPEFGTRPFPRAIDDPSWRFNDPRIYQQGSSSKAHLFITRTGRSATAVDYGTPWRAVKAELCVLLERSRGRFLHNELVQPRRSATRQPPAYQELAPDMAFMPAQLDRLALAYVAASVRAGRWLIPAYHAVVDERLPGGHDDPQRFDLQDWSARVAALAAAVQGDD